MKAQDLRDIAARLNRWADELEGIKTDGGGIKVTLPGPTLFDALDRAQFEEMQRTRIVTQAQQPTEEQIKSATKSWAGVDVDNFMDEMRGRELEAPARRVYKRVGCKMRDEAIVAANKVGRAQGYCQRSDIERSLRRANPERSREEIREAVNAAVAELGLTCIVYNSYRYYRKADRGRVIAIATANLCA